MQDMSQLEYSSESVILHATENSEIISLNPTGQAEIKDTTQFELSVKSTDDSAAMQEVSNPDNKHEHPTKENNLDALDQINEDTRKSQTSDTERLDAAVGQLYETEGQGETDIKPSAEQMSPQKEELFSEVEKTKLSLQSHQSETYTPFDSQPWDKHVVMDEQNKAHFNPTGNRRKLGSSRRNKGGRHVNGCSYKQEDVENIRGLEPLETTKMSLALQEMGQEESSQESEHVAESYQIPTQELVGNTMGNKRLETPKMSLTTETAIQEISMESMLEVMDKFDTSQTGDISDAHIDTYELNSISVHSNSTVAQPVIDQSNSRKMPDKDIPHMYSATDTEIKEGDNDTDFILQCEILQANDLKPEGNRPYITLEITPENNSCREQTEPECSVEKVAVSSPKEELLTDEEQNEHFSLCKVRGAQHTETAVKKVHTEEDNPEPIQEMHQIDYISVKESKSSLQTLQSEEHACLDSHPKDNFQSTKEETHTGFKPTGNRRKLGSSRRNKGKQHVLDSGTETYQQPKEKVVENTETINIPLSTESTKQQIDTGFKPAEKIRQIRSTLNEGENTEKVPEEDTLSQNVMDISTAVTADITSRSDKDDFHKFSEKVNEEEKKHNLKESENSTLLTGYDRVKTDLIQSSEASVCNDDSDIRIISYHDDNITFRSITSDVLCQEEVFQVQAMETLPYDKDLLGQQIHIQQTNFVIEMVGDEVGRSIQQHGQDQVEESCEHPTKKGQDEHLEGKSKQKKRKIGSTRRTGLLRKQEEETGNTDEAKESNLHTEIDMRDLDSTEVVEDLPLIVTTELAQNETAQPSLSTVVEVQQETSSVCDLGQNLQSSTSDLHTIECNMIAKTDDLMALLSEQSASHHETVVNPVTFIHGADVRNYGEIVGAGEEPSEGDDFTSTVMVTERNRHSVNQLLPPNTEDAVNTDSGITVTFCEISPSTQNDEQSPDDTKVIQDQDLKSSEEEPTNAKASIQKPMNEEAHNINIVMKKASPNFSSANRRRKMGSTRRNLGSHHKGEDLHQKQDVDNEATATDVGDVLSKGVSGIKEDLQLQKEHTESDLQKGKEKVFETVKYSHTGVSQLKVLAQQAVEEDLPSLSNILETEHQLTSDDFSAKPSTSPKRDTMSESISGGRRRKMGSHRKSSGHHTHETATEGREIDAEQGRDVRGLTDEEHRKESLGLDKISEVDESGTKPSSNISRSKGGGPIKTLLPQSFILLPY
uniref:uncharacterized protein LOC109958962 n=1 Tax=Monopterus albus TaxID=43700 RepID=UPI0009B42ACD|nr:uncharacterized protein LOC109958962 [Monopterus albus]